MPINIDSSPLKPILMISFRYSAEAVAQVGSGDETAKNRFMAGADFTYCFSGIPKKIS